MSQVESSSISVVATAPADAERKKEAAPLALAGTAGILGSLCCVGPLVAVSLGIGGGVAAAMVAFEPYRPLFILIAIGALGYAGWKIFRKPPVDCTPGSACAIPDSRRTSKIVFGIVAAAVLLLLAFPYFAPLFY